MRSLVIRPASRSFQGASATQDGLPLKLATKSDNRSNRRYERYARRYLEVETGDRIREPGARIHRAGVVQVRPVLEQFVPRREVAIVEDGTELFEKIHITDRLRAFEHRQVDEDELRAMGFRLARLFFQ